jgi:hypothetical protein
MLVMRQMLIGTTAAHTATARQHASATTDYANDEQHDAHKCENNLQMHIHLQEFFSVVGRLVATPQFSNPPLLVNS